MLLLLSTGTAPTSTFHTIGANLPQLSVEVDFVNDPTSTVRAWTDVTTDVRALSYTRCGRNNETQRSEAGTLRMLLDNRDGAYDPTHNANVKRMRWLRIQAKWGSTVYPRWTGVIENWKQTWPQAGKDAVAEVSAVDAFKPLNLFDLATRTYPAQTTGERVKAVLDDAGVVGYTLETGQSTLPAIVTPFEQGSMALSHLLEVEGSENGLMFAGADGDIVFHDRHHRLLHSGTSAGTVGDAAGEIPYRDPEFDLDDPDIFNVVSVTPAGGAAITVTDTASVAAYFPRTLSKSLLITDVNEATDAANYLLTRYADPAARVPRLDLLGRLAPTSWPTVLSLGNSDRVTWKRRATAATISGDYFVERVSDEIVPGNEWRVQVELSPAVDQIAWVLGDSANGILETTSRLSY